MVVTETGGTPGIYCVSIQRYRTYNVWQSQRRTDPIRHDFQINIPHVAKKLVYNMEIQYLHIIYIVQGMIYTVLIDTEFPECKYINQIFYTIRLRIYQYMVTILVNPIIKGYAMAFESTKQHGASYCVCHGPVMPCIHVCVPTLSHLLMKSCLDSYILKYMAFHCN